MTSKRPYRLRHTGQLVPRPWSRQTGRSRASQPQARSSESEVNTRHCGHNQCVASGESGTASSFGSTASSPPPSSGESSGSTSTVPGGSYKKVFHIELHQPHGAGEPGQSLTAQHGAVVINQVENQGLVAEIVSQLHGLASIVAED